MKEILLRIKNDKIQKVIYVCFLALFFLYPLIQYTTLETDRMKAFQSCLLIIVFGIGIFCILTELINKRLNFTAIRKITWISIALLILFGFVSVFFSKNKEISLYGSVYRYEGFFSLLGYYSIFCMACLLTDRAKRNRVITAFFISGIIISITGMLQFFDVLYINEGVRSVARVPMVNQNFFASYSILLSGGMLLYLFLLKKNEKHYFKKFFGGTVALLIFYVTGLCCMSSVIYVGIIMCFVMLICINYINKQRKLPLIISMILLYVITMLVLNWVSGHRILGEFATVWNQIAEEESILGDSVGSGRMRVWKQIVSLLPEYGLFGCGIEQFGSLYIERFGFDGEMFFDRAHNEYLHIWITEGIFALSSYLTFLFAIYIPGHLQFLKKGKYISDDVSKICFLAFFGYIAQAFFNISVIQVAPYFWMICGLLVGGIEKKSDKEESLNLVSISAEETYKEAMSAQAVLSDNKQETEQTTE